MRSHWRLRPDTVYLNHGSFGPPPIRVQEERAKWQSALDAQPMDFYVRQLTPAWLAARERLASYLHTGADNLVFCENATAGMNVVARSFPLSPGDEVLLTNHEYGAVRRIWERACRAAGAAPPRTVDLSQPFVDAMKTAKEVADAVTPQTRLVIVSHITSPTAVTLPVAQIARLVQAKGAALCIDGPHAISQLPLDLDAIGAEYYTASCHKWLSAPFGSGFLHVHPRCHTAIQTPQLSWGRLQPDEPHAWWEEFLWSGTRDYSPYLSIPAAIDFLEEFGIDRFRQQTHDLAAYARRSLLALGLCDRPPLVPDDPAWYGTMAHVPLPAGDSPALQKALWEGHGIEVPIVAWGGERWIRVSCHLYNHAKEVDSLVEAIAKLVGRDGM